MTSKEHTDHLNALFAARKKTRQADIQADDEFIKAARLILRELVMSETSRAEMAAGVERLKDIEAANDSLKVHLREALVKIKDNEETIAACHKEHEQAIALLKAENADLQKRIAEMETHPDVIAAKEAKAAEQRAKRVAELEAAAKKAADELAKLKGE